MRCKHERSLTGRNNRRLSRDIPRLAKPEVLETTYYNRVVILRMCIYNIHNVIDHEPFIGVVLQVHGPALGQ